jgi:hypothetical protein
MAHKHLISASIWGALQKNDNQNEWRRICSLTGAITDNTNEPLIAYCLATFNISEQS